MKGLPWTAAETEQLRRLMRRGTPVVQMAKIMERAPATVRSRMAVALAPPPPPPPAPVPARIQRGGEAEIRAARRALAALRRPIEQRRAEAAQRVAEQRRINAERVARARQ